MLTEIDVTIDVEVSVLTDVEIDTEVTVVIVVGIPVDIGACVIVSETVTVIGMLEVGEEAASASEWPPKSPRAARTPIGIKIHINRRTAHSRIPATDPKHAHR